MWRAPPCRPSASSLFPAPGGQRVLVYEYPTGRRLLNAQEQEERADRAEERARRQAEALKAAEEKLRRLPAELERRKA